jgi:ParB family transcriptional regulator, chromosome partitioning protein
MSKAPEHRRKALGKGLAALLPQKAAAKQPKPTEQTHASAVAELPIDEIKPNPLQPRSVFQPDRLAELAQSIRANGIIQPLIVRRVGDTYELIAGERRWRAARMASLETVPALVQDFADDRLLEITLIENIQREDLNPIEVAQAFDRMGRDLHLSHEEIGKRTGKDRSTVTNMLRLLRLPNEVQILLAERRLSMGHARALLGLPTDELQLDLAAKSASQGLSVRQVERMVQKMTEPREAQTTEVADQDPNIKAAAQELERVLGTRVRIVEKSAQRGRLEIEYYSQEDLQRVYEVIVGDEG